MCNKNKTIIIEILLNFNVISVYVWPLLRIPQISYSLNPVWIFTTNSPVQKKKIEMYSDVCKINCKKSQYLTGIIYSWANLQKQGKLRFQMSLLNYKCVLMTEIIDLTPKIGQKHLLSNDERILPKNIYNMHWHLNEFPDRIN